MSSESARSMPGLRVRVAAKAVEAESICSFELVAEDGGDLPSFSAGSHVEVQLPFERTGLARPYSLCNCPSETHRYRIAVLEEPSSRGGSRAMHAKVHEGMTLDISQPKNHFALSSIARQHLLLAGGIGVTPILAMAQALANAGADFEMHYAERSQQRMAFADELRAAPFAPQVHLHLDDGAPEQRLNLAALLAQPRPEQHLYVCGPAGFLDAVLKQARASGWAEAQLHWESFSPAVAAVPGDGGFEVQIGRAGRIIPVAADCSVLQALRAEGIDLPSSCEHGVGGTCLTGVLEGEPEHRDQYLMPEEQAANDQFLPCCSRSRSARLVLAL